MTGRPDPPGVPVPRVPVPGVPVPGVPVPTGPGPRPELDPATLTELAALLAAAAGEDAGWAAGITAATCLHDDLELESVELAALAVALRDRYGPAVDLDAYLTELDLDELIELTVGDLAAYLTGRGCGTRADRTDQ